MFILETLNFVVDILKVPSVLVGLIALIGYCSGRWCHCSGWFFKSAG